MRLTNLPKNVIVFLGFITIIGLSVFLIPSKPDSKKSKQ